MAQVQQKQTMQTNDLPGYVYKKSMDPNALSQGDVLKPCEWSTLFDEFYKSVSKNTKEEHRFAMVVSQTCDICRKDDIKIPHINIALVRPLHRNLSYTLQNQEDQKGLEKIGDSYLLDEFRFGRLSEDLVKLVNNNDKTRFFLPKMDGSIPFDMVAILTQFFPFRADQKIYDMFLKARVASLEDIFSAKVGRIISDLYSRISSKDLVEMGMDPTDIRRYVDNIQRENKIFKATEMTVQKIKERGVTEATRAIIEEVNQELERSARNQQISKLLRLAADGQLRKILIDAIIAIKSEEGTQLTIAEVSRQFGPILDRAKEDFHKFIQSL